MKKGDWGIEILKVENGYLLKDNEGKQLVVETEDDELATTEKLLWEIVNFFNLSGNKYDRERILITRKTGERYTPQKDEKIVKEIISKLQTKNRQ